jgi:hypothetical protein
MPAFFRKQAFVVDAKGTVNINPACPISNNEENISVLNIQNSVFDIMLCSLLFSIEGFRVYEYCKPAA